MDFHSFSNNILYSFQIKKVYRMQGLCLRFLESEHVRASKYAPILEDKWRKPRLAFRRSDFWLGGDNASGERVLAGSQWSFCKGPVLLVPAAAAWSWLAFRSSRHLRRPSLNKSVHNFVFWRTQHRIDVNSLLHISAWSCSIFHTSWASDPLVSRHRFCSASRALQHLRPSCCLYSACFLP